MFNIKAFILMIVIFSTQLLHAQTYKDLWFIYDNLPSGAKISNASTSFKENNKTVELLGSTRHNGYRYTFPSSINHHKTIQCSFKYDEEFSFYISISTQEGSRYITYTSENTNRGKIGSYIYIGLGEESINGEWHTLERNLSEDLKTYEEHNKIISVNAFLVRGSGIIENPILLTKQDTENNTSTEENNTSTEENNTSTEENLSNIFNIKVFKRNNKDTFEITNIENDQKIRISLPEEEFYIIKGGSKVEVSYKILKKENGVDIEYIINNNMNTFQRLPYFQVNGLKLGEVNKVFSTNLKEQTGRITQRNINEKFFKLSRRLIGGKYPGGYSPIIIAKNNDFTVGASLNYSIINQPHSIYMDLYYSDEGAFANSYRITFTGMDKEENQSEKYMLAPHTTFKYTIPLRFSNNEEWISTIKPYKDYFNSLYRETESDILPRDTRPIYGAVFSSSPASGTISSGNTRGYYHSRRIDKDGLFPSINALINTMNNNGYKRSMLWSFSGCYHEQSRGLTNWSINYPPQFISNLLPKVQDSLHALDEFNYNDLRLGFWWGHAGKLPSQNQWNPTSLKLINPNDSNHRLFGLNELQFATSHGANEIGLDAFGELTTEKRLQWIKILKTAAPEVRFTAEGGNTVVDYMHAKVGIFIHPSKIPTGPNVLANYLNPNAEIQVYFTNYKPKIHPKLQDIENLINWGLTPVLNEHVADSINLNLLNLNTQ